MIHTDPWLLKKKKSFCAAFCKQNCFGEFVWQPDTCPLVFPVSLISSHQSFNREGRWGTTDNFATSFVHFSLFSTALWDLANSRAVHSLMLSSPPLLLSALSSSPFHCALQGGFCQIWWTGDMIISLQFASLYDGQDIFLWSNCLLDLGTDFHVGNMVFAWDVQYLAVAPHFHGLYSSLELCCEGPWATSIQEDECGKGAHQLYLGAERNTPVISN